MSGTSLEQLKRIESSVASALGGAGDAADIVRREIAGGLSPSGASLGALYGAHEYLKTSLSAQHGGRLAQTESFKLVDQWGRLTALASLLGEIERTPIGDGEAARARSEVFWRGILDCALNLARDVGSFVNLGVCAPLTDVVVGTARKELAALSGSIQRMVDRS